MYIHYVYVQIKNTLLDHLIIIKFNKDSIDRDELHKLIYISLYHDNVNNEINYFKLFYIKKGFNIKFSKSIWNKFISLSMKNLEIVYLIDTKHLLTLHNKNILNIEYIKNKNEIQDIIIESYQKKNIWNRIFNL